MKRSNLVFRSAALAQASMLALAAGGCDFQPYAPSTLHYTLSSADPRNSVKELRDNLGEIDGEAAGAQILGALESLFGTPGAPGFALTEHLVDDLEINPNTSDELTDDELDLVEDENRTRRFKRQIALIRAGRFTEVPEPDHARDLWAQWTGEFLPALLEDPDAQNDVYEMPWREAAVALFEEHYPTLRESAELFRVQCMHCHGVEGGGNGPTAAFLDPRPRDYRQGVFKWVSVDRNKPPRREDLLGVLERGVTFTAMQSYARLSRGELEGLVDYVRLLSIRGQVEWLLVKETANSDNRSLDPDVVTQTYNDIWDSWVAADEGYVYFDGEVPRAEEMTPERIERGKALFRGNVANCYTCHGVFGRGDGASLYEPKAVTDSEGRPIEVEVPVTFTTLEALPDYDHIVVLTEAGAPGAPLSMKLTIDGESVQKTLSAEELASLKAGRTVAFGSENAIRLEFGWKVHLLTQSGEPVMRKEQKTVLDVKKDEWGDDSRPRNFQQTVFRGGGRPIDLYRRLKHGIGGTIMPAADPTLSPEDIWNIVYYVYSVTERFDPARIQEDRVVTAPRHEGGEEAH